MKVFKGAHLAPFAKEFFRLLIVLIVLINGLTQATLTPIEYYISSTAPSKASGALSWYIPTSGYLLKNIKMYKAANNLFEGI